MTEVFLCELQYPAECKHKVAVAPSICICISVYPLDTIDCPYRFKAEIKKVEEKK